MYEHVIKRFILLDKVNVICPYLIYTQEPNYEEVFFAKSAFSLQYAIYCVPFG